MTYDIADTEGAGTPRLGRVAQTCEKYGQRAQFSVFECRQSAVKMARLIGEIQDIIDSQQDAVIVYRFPGSMKESRRCFGRGQEHVIGEPWLL